MTTLDKVQRNSSRLIAALNSGDPNAETRRVELSQSIKEASVNRQRIEDISEASGLTTAEIRTIIA